MDLGPERACLLGMDTGTRSGTYGGTSRIAELLARNWWTLVLRGVAGVVFGILTFVWPGMTLAALIVLFAIYALVDGGANLVAAMRGARQQERWGLLLLEGLAGIAVGVIALAWPGLTAIALLFWIATWAMVTGVLEIAAAIHLRREMEREWLLALAGICSVAFGLLLFMAPGVGALAVLYWIGAYALIFGVLLIGLGFRVRSAATRLAGPMHGAPTPA